MTDLFNHINVWGESIHNACKLGRFTIENLSKYVDKDLCGACGIASYFLKEKIEKHYNLKVDLVLGKCFQSWHCWLEINDYIVDVTHTQFYPESDKVSIFPTSEKDWNWKIVCKNNKAIKHFKSKWSFQNPLLYKVHWIENYAILLKKEYKWKQFLEKDLTTKQTMITISS